MKTSRNEQGAVLVVGLLLLVIITILAISGMNTATTGLAMARNDQNYENAFQAAESGLEQALARGAFNTVGNNEVTRVLSDHELVSTTVQFEDTTLVPDKAFSLGAGSGIAAYHFLVTATAKSLRAPGSTTDRDSTAVHTQAFYIVGPGSPTL